MTTTVAMVAIEIGMPKAKVKNALNFNFRPRNWLIAQCVTKMQ